MLHLLLTLALVGMPAPAEQFLGTVHLIRAVLANGALLPPGPYEMLLTDEAVPSRPGQPPGAERWVELVANGHVVAREAAVVLHDEARPVGTSSASGNDRPRVELKEGKFLRVSVKRGQERYLIHFFVAP